MSSERFLIEGELSAPGFQRWLQGHARRIGISAQIGRADADAVLVTVDGPPALLDAMEMACLLGPIDVWVESVTREAA
ncbi:MULTISPECIES: acylphosphatase [Paracoccus]|jgi:acylphosphatase|uniref:Acylphosphatase n=1 Tax=Paracoccus litorisediminis TaxID=2006130 RepID=A0A844HL85_9RHOB|nr:MULTISPECIES: acylphosphatase [Paracoccus]MBD9528614.1 acylphosphatase [Paracoccus sp. PAR01]MTH60616.1 acylphosphatase [Paracoccus litorisediminis]